VARISLLAASPSRRTFRKGKEPSPWALSLPSVADKRDNFCATYWISLSPQLTRRNAARHVMLTDQGVEFFQLLQCCEKRQRFPISRYRPG
jgi:hypothetical protein